MHARDLMTLNPSFVRPSDAIGDAAAMMASCDVGSLPVVDGTDGRGVVGMLTDRDITTRCTALRHDPMQCTVADHMTSTAVQTVTEHTPLNELVEMMERAQVRRLPVVDSRGQLLGIVGQGDLARQVGPTNPELVEELLERVSTPT